MSEPVPPPSGWGQFRQFLSQYFVPTAIASIVATLLSVFTAVNAAKEQQRDYNTKFESLVNAPQILSAFGGVYVANPTASAYELDRTKASYTQTVREQQAAATLLALQSVAESETQRRTVLLIGARLLNADSTSVATGAEAARLLTILIDEADRGRQSWNPFERSLNSRLWQTIDSTSFMDLVTAGYANDYYNDQLGNSDLRPYWTTLNGDVPVSHDAKFQLLRKLTAPQYEGWVHLATFNYSLPSHNVPQAKPDSAKPAQSAGSPLDLVADVSSVMLRHDLSSVGSVTAQYAIPDFRQTPPAGPLFAAPELIDRSKFPATWLMLKPRLLRVRPPVEYINPDGSFKKGSLGRIVGVVPPGSCITVVEPLVPVLVFLPSYIVANKPAPAGANAPVEFAGLVHMWAHVRATKSDEDCLAGSAPPN
ncbi:MAG: hypothetical protein WAJ85_11110 [Candidatus Baltobacteraceae bacterium]|jgi:hypothetical protein